MYYINIFSFTENIALTILSLLSSSSATADTSRLANRRNFNIANKIGTAAMSQALVTDRLFEKAFGQKQLEIRYGSLF